MITGTDLTFMVLEMSRIDGPYSVGDHALWEVFVGIGTYPTGCLRTDIDLLRTEREQKHDG